MDRATLVKRSLKRLKEQYAFIVQDIAWDEAFIEEKTQQLPYLGITKQQVEQQVAERMERVSNLRSTLQMIELTQELLLAEQERLKKEGTKKPVGGGH